ncbi:heterodisulfide reductase-related iron-sulfur binding cluster [Azospirillum agricola]|uniref:heterodisulfide reductase-related iron-sulfur binding cluster n=1 Tax=Azospirillum agricola TaxID=1720247 RepID=UPI000A0EF32E|nr:heterodisulfide reductase-related iron-sulfur binding cluster [Azospirillum agricola]SMH56661.1 Cysteine-rich domain-containing protein [Azospirillum lipoferum]
MREGSLEPPVRHPLDWQNPDFSDEAKLDAEMRRVFDICHGCRRCFNLCDSFPRLFDLIDAAGEPELHGVPSGSFKSVVDACTLCDMCFMTKCPYVPPHPWALDFPHLMVRHRAVEAQKHGVPFALKQLTQTDRNGELARPVAAIANWASAETNRITRPLLEKVAGVHREAHLPKFNGKTLAMRAKAEPLELNRAAPAFGKRKAVLYATCFANYNNPAIGMATRAILARNGVESAVVYPACCGMPQLEQGDLAKVDSRAATVAAALGPWIDKGYDVIALVPSCALMLKLEWPLIVPRDAPHRAAVEKLAQATFDVSEYIVDIARRDGLAEGLEPLPGGIALHVACHARAQNMGQKAAEMLRLIPKADLKVIERCSGHGGSWGVLTGNFPVALKVGKPVATQALKAGKSYVASECPIAGPHIMQGIDRLNGGGTDGPRPENLHPVELFARAYGITV